MMVDGFCKSNCLEYEVIDLGKISVFAKFQLRVKGINTPAISLGKKTLCGIPSNEDIKKFLAR